MFGCKFKCGDKVVYTGDEGKRNGEMATIEDIFAEFPIWGPGDFLKGDRPERLLAS